MTDPTPTRTATVPVIGVRDKRHSYSLSRGLIHALDAAQSSGHRIHDLSGHRRRGQVQHITAGSLSPGRIRDHFHPRSHAAIRVSDLDVRGMPAISVAYCARMPEALATTTFIPFGITESGSAVGTTFQSYWDGNDIRVRMDNTTETLLLNGPDASSFNYQPKEYFSVVMTYDGNRLRYYLHDGETSWSDSSLSSSGTVDVNATQWAWMGRLDGADDSFFSAASGGDTYNHGYWMDYMRVWDRELSYEETLEYHRNPAFEKPSRIIVRTEASREISARNFGVNQQSQDTKALKRGLKMAIVPEIKHHAYQNLNLVDNGIEVEDQYKLHEVFAGKQVLRGNGSSFGGWACDGPTHDYDNFTVSAWVASDVITQGTTAPLAQLQASDNPAATKTWTFSVYGQGSGGGEARIRFSIADITVSSFLSSMIPRYQMNHVMVTVEDASVAPVVTIYQNGVQHNSNTATIAKTDATHSLRMFYTNLCPQAQFMLWDRVLTRGEITKMYQLGVRGPFQEPERKIVSGIHRRTLNAGGMLRRSV